MFPKSFLLVISTISLLVIVFVSFELINNKDNLKATSIFGEIDGKILIINRSQEVQLENLNYPFHSGTKEILNQLVESVYPDEQIFISEKRPLLLIVIASIWNEESVLNYLKIKNITFRKINDDEYLINSNFKLRFNKTNLIIFPNNYEFTNKNEFEWPNWDKLASASIIQLTQPLKSTNIYYKKNGIISYETNIDNTNKSSNKNIKIDDVDLFAQELPADISSYEFLEKNYAQSENFIQKNSPLYQWIDDGFILFEYNNVKCILSDYNKLTDPLSLIMNESINSNDANKHHFVLKNALCKNFSSNLAAGFYIDFIGDKLIITTNKETLNQILTAYQLGNTLALDVDKFNLFFNKLPKKVNYRKITPTEKYSLTSYKKLRIKTILAIGDLNEEKDSKNNQDNKPIYSTFGVQDEILKIYGKNDFNYCFTKSNSLYCFGNKKQIWKAKLDGALIGEPKEIDLYSNGNNVLLFNTNNSIYLISKQGENLNEFPLKCKSNTPISYYKWNNNHHFLIINNENELLQIDEKGKVLKKLKISCGSVIHEINVYRKNGVLIANVLGSQNIIQIDLEKNKQINKAEAIVNQCFSLKNELGYDYFEISQNGIMKISNLKDKINFINSNYLKNFKFYNSNNQQYITCNDASTIYIISEKSKVKKINFSDIEIDNYDILFDNNRSNKIKAIAILDGIQNKIHLLDEEGKALTSKFYDGKNTLNLSFNKSKIQLTTTLKNNVIQYEIN
jgi:hypothetical protein